MPAWLLITSYYLRASKLRNLCYFSTQQVAPQAAKTMSPQFTPMGGFVGGPTNTFGQMPTGAAPMPTGAAPTATSGTNYSQMNARASLNNNGFGRLCVYCVWGFFFFFFSSFSLSLVVLVCSLNLFCTPVPDGSQSGAQFPPRAAEAVWPQWQGQQHSQSNSEQGNQQDIFPVSDTSSFSFRCCFTFLFYVTLNKSVSFIWLRMCCLCWTSLPTSATRTLRFLCTRHLTSDLEILLSSCLNHGFLYLALLLVCSFCSSPSLHGFNCTATRQLRMEG